MELQIIVLVFSCLFFIGGFIFCFFGIKKIKHNEVIEKNNNLIASQLLDRQAKLDALKNQIERLQEQGKEIQDAQLLSAFNYFKILEESYEAKEKSYEVLLSQLKAQKDEKTKELEKQTQIAFNRYVEKLESSYSAIETEFDKQVEGIKDNISKFSKEFEKIKKSYTSAREAQIQEEKIQKEADFYCLHLSEEDKITIKLIEDLKPRIPNPRVLCMLIWSTYYQKQMTTMCNKILGEGTVCGIYKIQNKKNGFCYVGRATDVSSRWKTHVKCGLGIDTPDRNKLYAAMREYGLTNFTFELLEQCEKDALNEREKFYIDLFQAYTYGYNSTIGNN